LKEKLTRSRLCACFLIFLGTLGSGLFGSHEDHNYSLESLLDKLLSIRVPIYLACVGAFVTFNILGPMRRPKGDLYRGVSLGMTAGTIAGNMFCVKASVELMETSIWREGGDDIWSHWLPYATLAGAGFFAGTNVIFMTRGLLEFEALFMVTIYEGSMIVSNCVSASVILLELEGLEPWRVAMYAFCVFVVCAGMFEVCWSEHRTRKKAEEEPNPEVLGVASASSQEEADFIRKGGVPSAATPEQDSPIATPATARTDGVVASDGSTVVVAIDGISLEEAAAVPATSSDAPSGSKPGGGGTDGVTSSAVTLPAGSSSPSGEGTAPTPAVANTVDVVDPAGRRPRTDANTSAGGREEDHNDASFCV
jgi:hypothetical protein